MDHLGDEDVDGRKILKGILKKQGLIQLRGGTSEHDHEHSEEFHQLSDCQFFCCPWSQLFG